MAKRARDVSLILHIGLHKTATSFLQNVFGARRYDLLRQGVLYPTTGTSTGLGQATRAGAQSGQTAFTRPGDKSAAVADLLKEIPASVSTVLMSAEDFSLPNRGTAEQHLAKFAGFGSVAVVLVLRRQDLWLESLYKQLVDQYGNYETRSFADFVREEGPGLLDFHARFSPWRELVGPENFHVISYDDVAGGAAICRRVLELAGIRGPLLDDAAAIEVPRYDSVRAIDTVGLRILNGYRLGSRDARTAAARAVYAAAPEGDIDLLTPEIQAGIEQRCAPINERIEAEWFAEPVPGLRFGEPLERGTVTPPSPDALVEYVDRVITLADAARAQGDAQ